MRFRFLPNLVSFLPAILAQTTVSSNKDADCRCLYGQSCWPSEQDFSSLSTLLSQPLIRPVPPASACYPVGNPSGNCSDVQQNWVNGNWRADQPGAYQNVNFETYTNRNGSISGCYLNTTLGLPCDQGSIPPIGVDVRTIEDVQAAVRFVGQHNLRLVVKNTGHDYLGRSAARNAFMIWTHHLKNISYNANFIPDGGLDNETVPALTLGAGGGLQWREAYAAVAEQERFILGGISTDMSVGAAGGWIMGGGHSGFSAKYGLGVDNAIQFTIVKADGDHVVANAHHNPDLFWALRGGGAGSWGVVTSVTYRTYDLVPLTMSFINATFSDPQVAQEVTTEFIGLHPKLSDAGWGGYSFFNNQTIFAAFLAPNVSWADTNATILPFFDFVKNATGQPDTPIFTQPFDNFHAWLDALQSQGSAGGMEQVGGFGELASRLISREAAEERPEETAQLLLSFEFVSINFVAGGAVARADPDSVGLHPGWRKAVAHVWTSEGWEAGDSGDVVRQARQRVAREVRRLEPISPDSATYMNEASLYEPDFRKSFFGSHYEKLRSIKRKHDPRSLFLVAEGVGSEDWNGSLTCPV
ncbi:FAD-binding domain-containing protein [Macrolepiota fuliginosa MF-IS2]|uniref:FAD-binding domain-containing protein n=1 Tax=Macrolepiota fuliginosa MF-IS2 TaxID=1400762 RepID=A0A9P5XKF1_9AGAR|nr:FAD-binding domain-containing protein [Macrolepiota fuliginosa MF-IS2]